MLTERPAARTYTIRGRESRPVDRLAAIVVSGEQTNPVVEHLGGRVEALHARLMAANTDKERRHCRRAIGRLLRTMGRVA